MNRETKMINNYFYAHTTHHTKVKELQEKYKNIKDFQVMFGYVVMDILNTNKEFISLNRKEIDIPTLAQRFFEVKFP